MKLQSKYIPLAATISLFAAMSVFGAVSYTGFLSPQVFLNLLIDNAFLVIVAVGMTFVILSGGIDLSVGSVVALSTIVLAKLVQHLHWDLMAGHSAGAVHGHAVRRLHGLVDPALPLCSLSLSRWRACSWRAGCAT